MKLEQWLLPIASDSTSYQHRYPQEGTFLPVFAVVQSQSHVRLFVTPWIAASQASLSIEFPRQEYWSGVPLPSLFPISRIRIDASNCGDGEDS